MYMYRTKVNVSLECWSRERFSICHTVVCLVNEENILCISQINIEFLLIFLQLVHRFLSEEFCEDEEDGIERKCLFLIELGDALSAKVTIEINSSDLGVFYDEQLI